jgi:hypothetical protein
MSTAQNDPPVTHYDPVALLGTIGTWVAVLLALIALVAVVAPILALKAARTEKNVALNAVRDRDEDYISKGLGFGREFRFFRKSHVPDLAPALDKTSYNHSFSIPRTDLPWTFHKVKATSCRTGWAHFCRLLEAYTAEDVRLHFCTVKSF